MRKLKSIFIAAALAASVGSAVAATCTTSRDAGTLGPDDHKNVAASFNSAYSFDDCFDFRLTGPSDLKGFTLDRDLLSGFDIDLNHATLIGPDTRSFIESIENGALGSGSFRFEDLVPGAYRLIISGLVTGRPHRFFDGGVGYGLRLETTPSNAVSPVPEPGAYALLALGLVAVGFASQQRKRRQG